MPPSSETPRYGNIYEDFDSPLMRQLRRDAHGNDIGQHSWVTAEELAADIPRLQLTRDSHLLDLGCGPCGPLTFVVAQVGCRGTGVDSSAEAIASGQARATSSQLEEKLTLHVADLNNPMPYPNATFGAVMSLDVILHLRDRSAAFMEVARVLAPGGRFLFTDAAVITGAVSNEEMERRAIHGHTQIVPPGFNDRMLDQAGLRFLEQHDRTASLIKNAAGRLAARFSHRSELEKLEGSAAFERQVQYLETVVALAERGALSRVMYLAESRQVPSITPESATVRKTQMSHIVLLGDSIFDNAPYTRGGPDVISQVRQLLPPDTHATLLAVDGATTDDIPSQLERMPPDASHLVLSVGGNNALMNSSILHAPADSTTQALTALSAVSQNFEEKYRRVVELCRQLRLPLTLCTIYNGSFPDREFQRIISTALMVFNDVILRVAIEFGLPVIDLRFVCSSPADYANPIEPSSVGGEKIARAIVGLVSRRQTDSSDTLVVTHRTPATQFGPPAASW